MRAFTVNRRFTLCLLFVCFVVLVRASNFEQSCTDALYKCNNSTACRTKRVMFALHCDALLDLKGTVCSSNCSTRFHTFLQDSFARQLENCMCNATDVCYSTIIRYTGRTCYGETNVTSTVSLAPTRTWARDLSMISAPMPTKRPISTLAIARISVLIEYTSPNIITTQPTATVAMKALMNSEATKRNIIVVAVTLVVVMLFVVIAVITLISVSRWKRRKTAVSAFDLLNVELATVGENAGRSHKTNNGEFNAVPLRHIADGTSLNLNDDENVRPFQTSERSGSTQDQMNQVNEETTVINVDTWLCGVDTQTLNDNLRTHAQVHSFYISPEPFVTVSLRENMSMYSKQKSEESGMQTLSFHPISTLSLDIDEDGGYLHGRDVAIFAAKQSVDKSTILTAKTYIDDALMPPVSTNEFIFSPVLSLEPHGQKFKERVQVMFPFTAVTNNWLLKLMRANCSICNTSCEWETIIEYNTDTGEVTNLTDDCTYDPDCGVLSLTHFCKHCWIGAPIVNLLRGQKQIFCSVFGYQPNTKQKRWILDVFVHDHCFDIFEEIKQNEFLKKPERFYFNGPKALDIDRQGSICVEIEGDSWEVQKRGLTFPSTSLWRTWSRNITQLEFDVVLKPNVLDIDVSEVMIEVKACNNSTSTFLRVSLADLLKNDTMSRHGSMISDTGVAGSASSSSCCSFVSSNDITTQSTATSSSNSEEQGTHPVEYDAQRSITIQNIYGARYVMSGSNPRMEIRSVSQSESESENAFPVDENTLTTTNSDI